MAKVTGPLYSMGASGKLGNAMVFFPWKGLAVVRKWLKPSNPESADQGNFRLIFGGLGKSSRVAEATSDYRTDAIAVAPSGKTWVSELVGYLAKNYMPTAVAYEAEVTEYEAHSAKAAFDSNAATLGLVEFDVDYKGTSSAFPAGLQLYMLAKYGIAKRGVVEGAFDRAPFTTALASWTSTEVTALVADLAAA